ncbi:MAG: rhomboid family intramembrane serine protease [Thermostichales cyanobacterium DRC_bins_46]
MPPRLFTHKLAETLDYPPPERPGSPVPAYNGVFVLIVINVVVFLAQVSFGFAALQGLYLHQRQPQFYQFVTSLFCHANWQHLSGNLFFLYIFGRIVEEEAGTLGVILSYLLCGVGANLLSVLFLPDSIVSLGASGAVFGLFSVSVLSKLSWDWRRLLEVVILGQFVIQQVFGELSRVGVADGINRVAHLGGALAGVVLVMGLRQWQQRQP